MKVDNKAFLEEYIGNLYPGNQIEMTVEDEDELVSKSLH